MDFERAVGVDFSAAERDAGRKTWIAAGRVDGEELTVESLADAASRLDCAPSREDALDALVGYLTGFDEPAVVGLDFPFSLPAELVGGDWAAFVAGTPERWGRLGDIDSPRALYDAARAHAAENGHSLRRRTDDAHGGQEPTGYRIKTQTYYGISRVLRGLRDDAAVVPFDDPEGESAAVVEAYPAAVFGNVAGAARTGYKRDTRAGVETRRENVEALRRQGVSFGDCRDFALATDDALDAVAAAAAAWRAAENGFETDGHDAESVEGHIFA